MLSATIPLARIDAKDCGSPCIDSLSIVRPCVKNITAMSLSPDTFSIPQTSTSMPPALMRRGSMSGKFCAVTAAMESIVEVGGQLGGDPI